MAYTSDPNDKLNTVTLRDHADVFIKATSGTIEGMLVTIDRPDRERESKVYWPTQASLARITRLLTEHYWPTQAHMTPSGWLGYYSGPALPLSPACPKCDDTGYTALFDGGLITDYCCDCAVGDQQFDFETGADFERDYRDAQVEQQAACLQ